MPCRISPFWPSFVMRFIIVDMSSNCLSRRFTSCTLVPDPAAMQTLERILHPMVRAAEQAFLARARRAGRPIAVLDIPLLLETGGERRVDLVLVASAPRSVQRARVRKRRRMTNAEIDTIIERQMPDAEKRRRADVIISTGLSRHHALRRLRRLIQEMQP